MDSNRGNTELNTSKTTIGFPGSVSSASAGVIGGVQGTGTGGNNQKFGLSDSTTLEERQLLGRYGVWLLVGLCTPNHDTQIEILGRLLSMLFHWFHITAYSFDGTKKSLMHLIFSVGNLLKLLQYTIYYFQVVVVVFFFYITMMMMMINHTHSYSFNF